MSVLTVKEKDDGSDVVEVLTAVVMEFWEAVGHIVLSLKIFVAMLVFVYVYIFFEAFVKGRELFFKLLPLNICC